MIRIHTRVIRLNHWDICIQIKVTCIRIFYVLLLQCSNWIAWYIFVDNPTSLHQVGLEQKENFTRMQLYKVRQDAFVCLEFPLILWQKNIFHRQMNVLKLPIIFVLIGWKQQIELDKLISIKFINKHCQAGNFMLYLF